MPSESSSLSHRTARASSRSGCAGQHWNTYTYTYKHAQTRTYTHARTHSRTKHVLQVFEATETSKNGSAGKVQPPPSSVGSASFAGPQVGEGNYVLGEPVAVGLARLSTQP